VILILVHLSLIQLISETKFNLHIWHLFLILVETWYPVNPTPQLENSSFIKQLQR
jgi:hypothetical protein